MKVIPIISKFHSHELKICPSFRLSKAQCDSCNKIIDHCGYYCNLCDWDICLTCYQKEIKSSELIPTQYNPKRSVCINLIDNSTILQSKDFSWETYLFSDRLNPNTGVYHCYLTYESPNLQLSRFLIGVATESFCVGQDLFIGSDNQSWGLSSDGRFYHNGRFEEDVCVFGSRVNPGETLEMIVDTDKGVLYYRRCQYSDYMVVARRDLYGKVLIPGVSLYRKDHQFVLRGLT